MSARQCFIVLEGQCDERGYIPSLVTEGERGHAPLVGNGDFASPWYWGETIEKAKQHCRDENAKLGLTEDDVTTIVCSSMRPEDAGIRFPANPDLCGECGKQIHESEPGVYAHDTEVGEHEDHEAYPESDEDEMLRQPE